MESLTSKEKKSLFLETDMERHKSKIRCFHMKGRQQSVQKVLMSLPNA